jgi:O-antigen ligase
VSEQAAALSAAGPPGATGTGPRGERAIWIAVALALALVLAAALMRLQANPILAAVVVALVLVAAQRVLLAWETMLGAILVVILFIPIRRYTVGGGLPFELEPYRALIAGVLACWLCAVAADPKVGWRRTGLEAPILTFFLLILLSMALNVGRLDESGGIAFKQISFFVSYFLVTYFVASVLTRGPPLDRMVKVLVAGGALVAVLSLVEWRTGTNMFNWFNRVMPFLQYVDIGEHVERGTGVRALGSAQHPIALGAALVMLIPFSVYLHRKEGRFLWMACGGLLTLGALASGSRTAALMLIVLLAAFLVIKRTETVRLLPWLLPLLVVCQVGMPGTLGTFRAILQPSYVVQEQSTEMGTGSGRIADLGPSLEQWAQNPFFGQGFGTRVSSQGIGTGGVGNLKDDRILDNQWLGLLIEIGAFGVLGLLWLFWRSIRRLARQARSDDDPDSWLPTALAASLAAFAIGMLTFDAFAFIQVTFFAFVMLGFTAVVTRPAEEGASRPSYERAEPASPAPAAP